MLNLKNIVECTINSERNVLILTHVDGGKVRYFGPEARAIFVYVNGEYEDNLKN